jgi:hypothetical protein
MAILAARGRNHNYQIAQEVTTSRANKNACAIQERWDQPAASEPNPWLRCDKPYLNSANLQRPFALRSFLYFTPHSAGLRSTNISRAAIPLLL